MADQPGSQTELQKIDAALAAQEALRGILPDEQIEATLASMRERRNILIAQINTTNISSTGNINVSGDVVSRDKVSTQTSTGDIVQPGGVKNVYQTPLGPKTLPLPEALRRYLDNLIDTHQHLRLQGIRAGGQPLSVDLEKVYVSLTTIEKRNFTSSTEKKTKSKANETETARVGLQPLAIGEALKRHHRLVIIGDPGSGKTTLLAYLALTYARGMRDGVPTVPNRLELCEWGRLPILLPLRDFGRHLKTKHMDSSSDGPAILINYLYEYYANQSIHLSEGFFEKPLEKKNRCVVLLDGMDEVAETQLRQRIARIIEKFAIRYPGNRFVVTSREVGYEGAARIGAEFGLAKVRDFSPEEVRHFVRDWTSVVEVKLAGYESDDILRQARVQADKLIRAIEDNPRISALATNPLLLTVIALVHRYRAALPERRSELYEEAVEVLLGRWDEAKGLETEAMLAGRPLDSGDRRSLLEPVALWLHEKQRREIELDELRPLLLLSFNSISTSDAPVAKAVETFLRLINERSGLLVERGVGIYGFAHLTFQEYLAARAIADRKDSLDYTLTRLATDWWREVILLEAGYLSTQGKRRVSELIRAIMNADLQTAPKLYHHLILAAECLYDVGAARVEGNLLDEVKRRLQVELDKPFEKGNRELIMRRIAAANTLGQIESGQFGAASKFWKAPWGEPEWVTIPASEFWMGSKIGGNKNEKPAQRVFLPEFQIARVPITNAQYALFVADLKGKAPDDWPSTQPLKGKENHPVVNISWHEAQAYCQWLSEKIGHAVCLPTEAEWEKAARGDQDQREYPWGQAWEDFRCNSEELGLGETSPVGLFLNGTSPYGCLDMTGNVWEWCRTKWRSSYSELADEMLAGNAARVLRGGSFLSFFEGARCTYRNYNSPDYHYHGIGFRVAISP